jgi:exodeoxyribonuclease V alpha subunit
LGYSPRGFRYHRHQQRPLDVLIIDEASMVDLPLMSRLLEAIPSHARIILLGDKDQLASVEAGSVLSDITGQQKEHYYQADFIDQLQKIGIVETGVIPTSPIALPKVASGIALLRKSYRFDDQSGIGQAAKMINLKQGKIAFRQVFQNDQYNDVRWLNHQNETLHPDSLDWAVEQYSHYLNSSGVEDALKLFEQFRILTALRAGEFGVETINQRMIQLLYQRRLIQAYDEFQGKPIMITCNDYELDLFNGDIGLLWKESESQRLYAYFPSLTGTLRKLPIRQLPEHETAFALTIHKSQGSEFKNLLLILPLENHRVLSKELIYTGVTRAKQQLMLAGDENIFIQACNKTIKRQSGLAEKLGW